MKYQIVELNHEHSGGEIFLFLCIDAPRRPLWHFGLALEGVQLTNGGAIHQVSREFETEDLAITHMTTRLIDLAVHHAMAIEELEPTPLAAAHVVAICRAYREVEPYGFVRSREAKGLS
ncbi:hypothetical protein FNU76_19345 [Chitinimonas arctica]|uniref:Uncharacterized protein n=1 Tax=Chitinimonas arctica TaxID=2594795 RepID=A0A516SJJ1_9NEIS|nr:hypothetical protein [Chitinimonas arctica]QDQ28332.1 hypothetical protein FNU76_19345 [Chitinimonas arctica]